MLTGLIIYTQYKMHETGLSRMRLECLYCPSLELLSIKELFSHFDTVNQL